jgi:membrane protease YdiL (CAAX protease family)
VPPLPRPSPGPPRPPWPLWIAPAALLLGFGLAFLVGSIVIAIVASATGSSVTHPGPAASIVGNVLWDLAFVAAALYFARLAGGTRPGDFGFRRVPVRRGIAAFVVAGLGYYIVSFVYQAILDLRGSDKLPSDLGVNRSTAAAIAVTVFVCVIAPMAEEFFFRGFLFGVLRQWRIAVAGRNIGVWVAAVITGILFGLAHLGSAPAQYLVPLGFLGFVLCLVRWRTGSLYPCIALHSFNNALSIGINQFHWGVAPIVAIAVGSGLVIAAITGPLAERPATA